MRKSRLVILPTKCLNQIGFLLLFLSCPVLGDWGRIQPESEASHNAIQTAREGTCGLQRDLPGGELVTSKEDPIHYEDRLGLDNDNDNTAVFRRSDTTTSSRIVTDLRGSRVTAEKREVRRDTVRTMTRRQDGQRIEIRRLSIGRELSLERNVRVKTVNNIRSRSLSQTENSEERRMNRRISVRRVAEPQRNVRERADIRLVEQRNDERRENQNYRKEGERMTRRRYDERRTNENAVGRVTQQNRESPRRIDSQINGRRITDNTRRLTEEKIRRQADERSFSRRMQDSRANGQQRRTHLPGVTRSTRHTRITDGVRKTPTNLLMRRVDVGSVAPPEKTMEVRDFRENDNQMDFTLPSKILKKDSEMYESTGHLERIGIKNNEGLTSLGGWTLNCVVGVVAYYMHNRQVKVV
ncbi:hypothetical protein RUM43_003717 [Polyplax serrata]|uniref:Uncharacterized protein n=1 Tax=Polyplax serrata TaxID=468196 RepID=A0AAN8P2Z7_POLSC